VGAGSRAMMMMMVVGWFGPIFIVAGHLVSLLESVYTIKN